MQRIVTADLLEAIRIVFHRCTLCVQVLSVLLPTEEYSAMAIDRGLAWRES
jgi:hypothetical protein